MGLQLAYNTSDSVVLVDEQGYQIGGRSWGPIDTSDPIGKGALDSGVVVLADEDAVGGSEREDAQAAIVALRDRRSRAEAVQGKDKAALAAALGDERLQTMETGGDGLPAKNELVDAVAADESIDVDDIDDAEQKKSPKSSRGRGQK